MGLIKYGIAVSDISGKVSGNVFARNKGGSYVRKWAKPTTTPTLAQSNVRNLFASANADFRALTNSQREAWDNLAKTTTFKNRLGEDMNLSGIALFIKSSMAVKSANLLGATIAEIDNAPADMLSPDPVKIPVSVNVNITTPEMTITAAEATVPTGKTFVVEATIDLPPSLIHVKNKFVQIAVYDATDAFTATNLNAAWLAKFGTLPSVGNVIWFRFRALDNSNGVYSPELLVSSLVVEDAP